LRKRVFFQNAAILTATSLILRSIGILFRIYVSNRIGAEGMGLYQLILSVYVLMASFATSGLTTAVTRLCTDEFAFGRIASAKRILYLGVLISIAVGAVSGVVLYSCADVVAVHFLHDVRAISSLRILTVSLPFMGASSCIKGYLMARRKVTSSSIAQILEQLVRIGVIWCILELRDVQTVEGACYTVLFGDTVAEAVSCLYMILSYLADTRHISNCDTLVSKGIFRRMMAISLPITGGRYLNSGLRTMENLMVPQALFAFTASREVALSQFGILKGMAMPLIFFPSSFLNAFSSLLIPEISEAKALSNTRQLQRTIERALHMTLLSSILISGVFFLTAYPLGEWLYHSKDVGRMLLLLAPLAPVMYLESVVVGILKGLDQQTHSLLYSVWDSVLRIVLIVLLVPRFGIDGFYAVMVFSNLLTCFLNLRRLCKVTSIRLRLTKWVLKPLLAVTAASAIPVLLTHAMWLDPSDVKLYTTVSAVLVSAVYLLLMPFLRCIEQEDMVVAVARKRQ